MFMWAVQYGGLAVFGLAALFGEALVANPGGVVLQYGGFIALITFMLTHDHRQANRMAKALDKKDAEAMAARERSARVSEHFTDALRENNQAIRGIADALKDRPCLMGDSRVKDPPVRT